MGNGRRRRNGNFREKYAAVAVVFFCFLEDDAPDIICVGNSKPKVHKQS